ncbi:MAG: hypothetical protein RID53_33390 [Coleofasciculus sp. B1-GNL1-01]|uniref:hypothetical protein n=1 Tax=Coleofasciculus sp. B1-GNL1-01 TaxID=3068484 RepID=UPI0032FF8014
MSIKDSWASIKDSLASIKDSLVSIKDSLVSKLGQGDAIAYPFNPDNRECDHQDRATRPN